MGESMTNQILSLQKEASLFQVVCTIYIHLDLVIFGHWVKMQIKITLKQPRLYVDKDT